MRRGDTLKGGRFYGGFVKATAGFTAAMENPPLQRLREGKGCARKVCLSRLLFLRQNFGKILYRCCISSLTYERDRCYRSWRWRVGVYRCT